MTKALSLETITENAYRLPVPGVPVVLPSPIYAGTVAVITALRVGNYSVKVMPVVGWMSERVQRESAHVWHTAAGPWVAELTDVNGYKTGDMHRRSGPLDALSTAVMLASDQGHAHGRW